MSSKAIAMPEPTESQLTDLETLLADMCEKLTVLWQSGDAGFVICHVGEDGGVVEFNHKRPKVKRKRQRPHIPDRKGW